MREGKEEGEDKQGLILLPAYRLLVPQAGNDTENREAEPGEVEGCLFFAQVTSRFQFTVFHPISYVDVQPYQHPEH